MRTNECVHEPASELLAQHGDSDAGPGLVDLAVNVRAGAPPRWLRERLAAVELARYPDDTEARAALAARHGRRLNEVLPTAGAAEAFVLIARALPPQRAVVVHPQFTEPEIALRAAGHDVQRVVLGPPFALDANAIPDAAELVVVGNPTNPTSVLHPATTLRAICRPGRTVVVDEAFADCVLGEPQSLASARDLPGLVVVRSLTKTWGLAGVRAGYLLAGAGDIAAFAAAQPRWPVSAQALEACVACSAPSAVAEAGAWAERLPAERAHLVELLDAIPGVEVASEPSASFVLVHVDNDNDNDNDNDDSDDDVRMSLREHGFAVRRGDTFPGLGPRWLRIAVRDRATSIALTRVLKEILCPTIS